MFVHAKLRNYSQLYITYLENIYVLHKVFFGNKRKGGVAISH